MWSSCSWMPSVSLVSQPIACCISPQVVCETKRQLAVICDYSAVYTASRVCMRACIRTDDLLPDVPLGCPVSDLLDVRRGLDTALPVWWTSPLQLRAVPSRSAGCRADAWLHRFLSRDLFLFGLTVDGSDAVDSTCAPGRGLAAFACGAVGARGFTRCRCVLRVFVVGLCGKAEVVGLSARRSSLR